MYCKHRYPIALVLSAILSCQDPAIARQRNHTEKAKVLFLATGTLVRGSWGYNQDVYFVELRSRSVESQLVRLIDEYNNAFPPLSREVLTSQEGTTLRVLRDAQCDLPYGKMILRAAPGDSMALLQEPRPAYHPLINNPPRPDSILPCYRTVRR
jgi:hypothetical protein